MKQCIVQRGGQFAERVVFVDGQDGCGKTMLSPIVAALARVEKVTFNYTLEYICALRWLGRIESDAAVTMIRMLTDLQLYDTMMSREVNFRPRDLSSVFRDADPWRYIRRLFSRGDEHVPDFIRATHPVLHLATHKILPMSAPIDAALGDRAVLIEVVRHPLYMLKQQTLNFESLVGSARDFVVYMKYNDTTLPYYARGWEELFLRSNAVERAIYSMQRLTALTDAVRRNNHAMTILTIPFEQFVLHPESYMHSISTALGTDITSRTRHMMRRQRVPRTRIAEGISLPIYKRCGWEPPMRQGSERNELQKRRQFAVERSASPEALSVLDILSQTYEEQYAQDVFSST